jgi:type I restriction enzyme S subunit
MDKVNLGELASIKTGRLDVNAENPNGKYPFFTCSKNHTYIDEYAFEGESVLVAGNGDLNVKFYDGKFNAYQRTYVIQTNKNLYPKYLYYFLNKYVEKLRELSIGGVIKYIKLGNLTDAQIPLPPLPQQQKIANILDAADELRQNNKKLIAKYDELTQALFLDMFGDPVSNPKGWLVDILGNYCKKIQIGPFGSQLHKSDYVDEGIPLINPTNINSGIIEYLTSVKITNEKYNSLPNYHLNIGDIIMARRGDLSKIGIVDSVKSFCGTGSLYLRLNDNINSKFGYWLLSHHSTVDKLYEKAQGVTMANLNKKIIINLPLVIPPINLQNQFAERIDLIEEQKAIAQKGLEKSEALFNSLLQKAFKGELV